MPRYMVERTFVEGLQIPADAQGAKACLAVVEVNAAEGVTWIHSYVTGDRSKTFCIYDGPHPEAIREAVRLLARAERPLLEAGRGVTWSGASDLEAFCAKVVEEICEGEHAAQAQSV